MIRPACVPRTFAWSVPVWQSDLDAFGEVRGSALLRLLQETATRASSDAGFDGAYYERTGTMWIIRRTTLTLAAPARYGDRLDVRTWIADFRRVRSQREYEVRSGERLVARASTDWVYVDRARGRPRRIPDEWERIFLPSDADAARRVPFIETPVPSAATTFERRVEMHDLDSLRHVNNANYLDYVEEAAVDAASAGGWPPERQRDAGGRLRATFHDLEYLDAALYGERLQIATWTVAAADDTIERHTHLHRGDPNRPLLQARSRHAWNVGDQQEALPCALRTALDPP